MTGVRLGESRHARLERDGRARVAVDEAVGVEDAPEVLEGLLARVLPVLGGVGALGEVLESFRMTRSEEFERATCEARSRRGAAAFSLGTRARRVD